MYDFISLRVNCPHCGVSLMDPNTLVDNIPGIKLDIAFDDNKGTIHLSSIYGSYNYTSNLKIPPGQVVAFSCPSCKETLESDLECAECNAKMVPLAIEEGGLVKICSRAGCKKHSVEFENLQHALEYFYQSFDYGETSLKPKKSVEETPIVGLTEKEEKEIIKSGAFLRTYCPHCEESLLEDNQVRFKVVAKEGTGVLNLSPYLNVFNHESTIHIPEGEVAIDIKCPECDSSLLITNQKCELCDSNIVGIYVAAISKLIDFYFCSKKGCQWHGLSKEDINDIVLEDSREW